MTQPKVAIAITADDKTARGAKSAEKRLGAIPKHTSSVVRRGLGDLSRQGSSAVRTLSAVEQATARVFGNRSVTSGLASRLGAVRAAGAAAGTGLGEAATAGGALTTVIGAVGTAAAATAGVLAAAAYGAFKLADGWAKGAAGIGRTAMIIGVAKKEMQEFSAAAERMGVDRAAATAGIGSLSQTLNDARYGRNTGAMAVLNKMGVKIQERSDGTVNVEAMLPAIADAIARQNSSGRRTAAHALGLSDELIPVLAQGGKALGAEMADAGKTAYIVSDDDAKVGERISRKGATVGQLKDRALGIAGRQSAELAEPGYDALLSAGRKMVGGATTLEGVARNTFAAGASAVERGGRAIERAAGGLSGGGWSGGAGRLTPGQVSAKARQGVRIRDKLIGMGAPANVATAMAANAAMESGGNHRAREKGGRGYGLFQITDTARRRQFKRTMGVDVERSSEDQQLRYQLWELSHSERTNWQRAQRAGTDSPNLAAGYSRFVERPKHKDRDGAERAAVASAMQEIPIRVTVDVSGGGPGTRARVEAGRNRPSISHAWARDH